MPHISPLHLCTTPCRCRCWRTSRDGPLLNGAVACCNSDLTELHLPAHTSSAWKSNSLSRTPVCFMIAFQGQQSTKILHQIEISTVWKNDTYAQTMGDGRKSKHRMGGNLGLLLTHFHKWDHLSFSAAV